MPLYAKESLELLKQRIDLVDVMTPYLDLKRAGASYKTLCPFHDERTPSFTIQKGDSHYHCFGCGAHGDAITFLMNHQKMKFTEAIESLAQKYGVHLDIVEKGEEKKGPNRGALKEAMEHACRFFHFMLLYTPEGHNALRYLYGRGLNLEFIRQFQIGLAPKAHGMLRKVLHAKFISDEIMHEAGLLAPGRDGGWRDFFQDRIAFPIRDSGGSVIGFSARKYKEDTFGGKYVNSTETPLFKKSRILFGLNYCRRRIAKERRAIIVEGQIDALRLIQAGFNITVAGQGTAFGDGHVSELLTLGVTEVFLALDADDAGQEAASKIGNLFQKEGVGVRVVPLPVGKDPDAYLREKGADAFLGLLKESVDYLSFLFSLECKKNSINTPAGKTQVVQLLAQKIREWNQPLMVYESLKKLAHLAQVPEDLMGLDQINGPNIYIKKNASAGMQSIDPDRILETDFLRWLLIIGETDPKIITLAKQNLSPSDLKIPSCSEFYQTFLDAVETQKPRDILSLTVSMKDSEGQELIHELLSKKIPREKAGDFFVQAIQKILERNWMQQSEQIKIKIAGGQYSDDEVQELVKQFNDIKKHPPKVVVPVQ